MPFYKKPRNFIPPCVIASRKSIKNGLRHSIFSPQNDKYVGDWKNDKKHGKGLQLSNKGELYEGDWQNGYMHGNGTLSKQLPSGLCNLLYRGEWVRGKPEGVGWYYFENGDVYFGFWKKGYRQGFGKFWSEKNKIFYVGYWNKNKKDGLGMLVKENGNRYEGNWKKNKKNGLGRYYHMATGQLQEGCWLDDICISSKMSDIIIRQCCFFPTEYPIPPENLYDSSALLEQSELWLTQDSATFDKQIKHCIDKMY